MKLYLNNTHRGLHNSTLQFFRNIGGIPSGPPLVLTLSFLRALSTNRGLKFMSHSFSSVKLEQREILLLLHVKPLENAFCNKLALSEDEYTMLPSLSCNTPTDDLDISFLLA